MKTPTILKNFLSQKRSGGSKKTLTDDDATCVSSTLSEQDNHKRLIGVTFDNAAPPEHPCEYELDDEVARELWYTRSENDHMKVALLQHAKVGRCSSVANAAHIAALELVYLSSCRDNSNFGGATNKQQQAANLGAQLQPQLLGMDHKLVSSLGKDVKVRRQDLLALVYNFWPEHQHLDRQQLAAIMRKKCRAITKPARTFAQQMASAQMAYEERQQPEEEEEEEA